MATILLIGNGFDLQCGLKTTYAHYFRWLQKNNNSFADLCWNRKNNREQTGEFGSFLLDPCWKRDDMFNVWEAYFAYIGEKEHYFWRDVEEEIKKSFEAEGEENFWKICLNKINNGIEKGFSYFYERQDIVITSCIAEYMYRNHFSESHEDFEKVNSNSAIRKEGIKVNEEEFYIALLDELKKFEKRFGEFIKKQVTKGGEEYKQNQITLFEKIMTEKVGRKWRKRAKKIKILSFNYTPIMLDEKNIKHLNLHGTMDEQPIFGISSSTNGSKYDIFEKGSRRADHRLGKVHDFIKVLNSTKKDNKMILYGLSLSPADLDYYRILFKIKDVKVYFCYTEYDRGLKISKEQMSAARELFSNLKGIGGFGFGESRVTNAEMFEHKRIHFFEIK